MMRGVCGKCGGPTPADACPTCGVQLDDSVEGSGISGLAGLRPDRGGGTDGLLAKTGRRYPFAPPRPVPRVQTRDYGRLVGGFFGARVHGRSPSRVRLALFDHNYPARDRQAWCGRMFFGVAGVGVYFERRTRIGTFAAMAGRSSGPGAVGGIGRRFCRRPPAAADVRAIDSRAFGALNPPRPPTLDPPDRRGRRDRGCVRMADAIRS